MDQKNNFFKGFVKDNPVFVLLLGLCPALGVTTSAINGLGMGLATTFVLVMSNIVVSLMGTDVYESRLLNFVNRIFGKYFWNSCIVKSERMKQHFGLTDIYVIPNGVIMKNFEPIDKMIAREELNWSKIESKIIFVSNPSILLLFLFFQYYLILSSPCFSAQVFKVVRSSLKSINGTAKPQEV